MTTRRSILIAATAAGAAAGGALLAWKQSTPSPAGKADDAQLLFSQRFPDLDGNPQDLAQWRGRPLIVNFWATWCPPCVKEMPALQAVRDAHAARGLEVIGLGIDRPAAMREFRDKLAVRFPLLAAGSGGTELVKALGNASGALPYTLLVNASGVIVRRRAGEVTQPDLESWLGEPAMRA